MREGQPESKDLDSVHSFATRQGILPHKTRLVPLDAHLYFLPISAPQTEFLARSPLW